jgi:tRNA (guanine26-N2/guanine27-N2)-dimethyltransferase
MLDIAETLDPAVYGTLSRMHGMLTMARDELELPFYVEISHLSSIARVQNPPLKLFVSALFNAGYDASFTHAKAGAIKTNAPFSFLWDLMRAWMIKAGVDVTKLKPNSPGAHLVERRDPAEAAKVINFDIHPKAQEMEVLRKSKLLRFQSNPQANWGPKARAPKN